MGRVRTRVCTCPRACTRLTKPVLHSEHACIDGPEKKNIERGVFGMTRTSAFDNWARPSSITIMISCARFVEKWPTLLQQQRRCFCGPILSYRGRVKLSSKLETSLVAWATSEKLIEFGRDSPIQLLRAKSVSVDRVIRKFVLLRDAAK